MSAERFAQDMPPKGGYAGIQWERVPLKKPWSGIQHRRRTRRENEEVTVALEPLLMAERDRIFLDQLRKNREEEADLMKNVPGWKVGTLYGEPLFKTIGDNIIDPNTNEYYAHARPYSREYMGTYDFWM